MIDPVKLAALLAIANSGETVQVCEYLKVEWSPVVTNYYASTAYRELPPFTSIGVDIEPRIISSGFHEFEINPDLRTETINITFDDIDKSITALFQLYESGIECEIVYFYPQVDLHYSVWFGNLQAPQVYGWKVLQTVATNGFRSREQLVPKRTKPRECTANFGGRLPTADAIRSNLCPYDRHVGGTEGLLNGAVPFTDCPRLTTADCTTRFGHARYFGGFSTDASATVSDGNSGYIAVSKGNASALKEPIRVVAGTKHVRGLQPLLGRRELNASNPDRGWYAAVYEVCEGPISGINNFQMKDKILELNHVSARDGSRGQATVSNYNPGGTISNFSNTCHFSGRYGWVNPTGLTVQDFPGACDISGFMEVAVFNGTASGVGLLGRYYSDTAFSALAGTRTDYEINFPEQTNEPFAGLPLVGFGIWWKAADNTVNPRYTESYTFTCEHDDGVEVRINGTLIINNAAAGTDTGVIALTANVPVSLDVKFSQSAGPAIHPWKCILKWQSASQAIEVVPNSRLSRPASSSYVRQWTDDRVWWLMEMYSNQRFGMAYPFTRFEIADWVSASAWAVQNTTFTHTFPNGEVQTYTQRRTRFDAILEGRPCAEQIEDICRSGAISVPFQHEGKFTVAPFRVATAGELSAARVFTDRGESRNIIWNSGQPSIELSQIPDDKLVNEIVLTFEEGTNKDTERPVTVDDPNQKLKAGRALGDNNLQSVPKRFSAFGCRSVGEVIKLGYRFLRFGEFDEGGTKNNLRAKIVTTFEQTLGLKRYGIIKLDSALLDNFLFPEGHAIEYFRILSMKKVSGGRAEITGQAYNHVAYAAFETAETIAPPPVPGPNPNPVPNPVPNPTPTPDPCILTFGTVTYDVATGNLVIPILPC